MILSVDLAARFSAATLLDRDRRVHAQFDSWAMAPREFVALIAERGATAEILVVEDVPYGISQQSMVKPVLRLQGRLIGALEEHGLLDRTLFIAPATWQRHFGVFRAGDKAFEAKAAEFGYAPPNLHEVYGPLVPPLKHPERAKALATLRKARTDYVAAYLIARWALDASEAAVPIRDLQGVQAV